MASVFAMMAFSAYDHRVGWSHVPAWACVLGDVLVAAGVTLTMLVVVQNGYAAATVTVETGQPVTRGFHAPAVHFKGKGFYNTDYGTRSRQRENAASKAAGDGSAKSTSDGEKKSEPKNEKKSEKKADKPAAKSD